MASVTSGRHPQLDRDVFRNVMGHLTSGVTVITARDGGKNYGMTASAVTSLSLDPPMLIVCLNAETSTQRAVEVSGSFAVNVLSENQAEVGDLFARPRGKGAKFGAVATTEGVCGQVLLDGALATLECKVANSLTVATHRVFFASVLQAIAHTGTPLAYYRGMFGRVQFENDDEVYQRLRELVLNQDPATRKPLEVEPLSRLFKMPESSIYFALTRLRAEGLLVQNDEYQLVPATINIETSDEAWDAKLMIELGTAERAIGNVAPDDLARLRKLMEATAEIARGTYAIAEYQSANAEFHEFAVSLAGNKALLDAYRRLSIPGYMLALRGNDHDTMEDYGGIEEHRRIVEGFEQGDIEKLRAAIRTHAGRAKHIHRASAKKSQNRCL